MKFFIQKRAGVTFFQHETLSLGIRKNHVDYVYKLKSGNHATVCMMLVHEGALLFTSWGSALSKIEFLWPSLSFKEGQCEKYYEILRGENPDASFIEIDDPDTGENITVLGRIVKCNNERHIMEISGYSLLLDKAQRLLDASFALYADLGTSGIPEIRSALLDERK